MEFNLPLIDDQTDCKISKIASKRMMLRGLLKKKQLSLDPNTSVEVKKLIQTEENFIVEDYYDILWVIGTGTYSKVYLAISKINQSKVAIKEWKGKNKTELLRSEFDLLKEIDDPIVPRPIEFRKNFYKNTSYLVLEYFEGITLDKYVEENSSLEAEEAIKVIKKLAQCINKLHKLGIAHRDIKPQNILINKAKEVKLIDFNISKKSNKSNGESRFHQRFMTQVSSPLFAAPEITKPTCYTESIDIWGVGTVLATMIYGSDIFVSGRNLSIESDYDEFLQIIDEGDIQDDIKEIIKQSLAYNPNDRPTAEELENML